MRNIAVVVGSLRRDSINKKLARNIMSIGSDMFKFTLADLSDVPLLNQDLEDNLPKPVVDFKKVIADADGVILVTPEYNRSIPAVMKNAVDWASRPYGHNLWQGKPVAMCGIAPGPVGTATAQAHLRSVLGMLGAAMSCQPEVYLQDTEGLFNEQGVITSERSIKFLRRFLESFAAWMDKLD